jgi:transcriptional regulator with XRE-family HTH domain
MATAKSIAEWMKDRGLAAEDLLTATGLDRKVLDRIVRGHYLPSPQQRQRLAAALGVTPEEVAWGHVNPVAHVHGHGPQFGRSP